MLPWIVSAGIVAVLAYIVLIWHPNYSELKRIWDSLNIKCGIGKQNSQFKYKFRTPSNISVRSTVMIPANFLARIDTGIADQIRRTSLRFPEWIEVRRLSEYRILVIDPMATNKINEPGSPAIMVKGEQAAGTCIGVFPHDAVKYPYIVVPHQEACGWIFPTYWTDSISNESEHVASSKNNRELFDHFQGEYDIHPNFP